MRNSPTSKEITKLWERIAFWLLLTQSVINRGFLAQKGEFFIRAVPVEGGGGEERGSGGGKELFPFPKTLPGEEEEEEDEERES